MLQLSCSYQSKEKKEVVKEKVIVRYYKDIRDKNTEISPSYVENLYSKYYKAYYKKNNLVKVEVINKKRLEEIWEYENGKITKKIIFLPSGEEKEEIIFSYYPDIKEEVAVDKDGNMLYKKKYVYKNEKLRFIEIYDSQNIKREVIRYKDNRPFRKEKYNQKGKLAYIIDYTYKNNHLIRETAYIPPDKTIYIKTYSTSGKLIKEEKYYQGKPIKEGIQKEVEVY
jgi:antitoxin component YwqK of YwqJK toxin-antitoxin module